MNRRSFLISSGILAAGAGLGTPGLAQAPRPQESGADPQSGGTLSFFVLSDSHFGWRDSMCPLVGEQQRNMDLLLERFPDLDFLVDSGDTHHSYAEDSDIADWSSVVQSTLGPRPLHFVAGNHEIDVWNRERDPEEHACQLASLTARPYYSFDLKGIHFLVIPQMIMMSFLTREALTWAKLDLAINRDRTTIILSHNSLKGTTDYQTDLGYRRTINSDEMLDIIRQNPQVVAWMHGHNHTYELVPADGVAYVSNGRFGGFNPEPLAGIEVTDFQNPMNNNLGGFLVRVTGDDVSIRAYNLSLDRYFDEIPGKEFLSWNRKVSTSLDAGQLPAVSYGHGKMHDGMRIPLSRHHVAHDMKRDVFVTGAVDEIINENSHFQYFTQRTLRDWQSKHLPGFLIRPIEESEAKIDPTWHWLDPGLRLDAKEDPAMHKMVICPGPGPGRRSYFRCVPGETYELSLEVDAGPGGQDLELLGEICSQVDQDRIERISGLGTTLEPGLKSYKAQFNVAKEWGEDSIFDGNDRGGLLQIICTARFSNLMHHVDIKKFELRLLGASGPSRSPRIAVGRSRFGLTTAIRDGQIASMSLPPRQESHEILNAEVRGGNRQVCVLIREQGTLWQIRNAEAEWEGGGINIGPLRNRFSRGQEIILAPVGGSKSPFVSRVRGAEKLRVEPFRPNRGYMIVDVREAASEVEVEISAGSSPSRVENAELVTFGDGKGTIRSSGVGPIRIHFG